MADQDPILADPKPPRVAYTLGRMLGAEDFQAEQNYHRSRMARVLRTLHGTGTAFGLSVSIKQDNNADNVEVRVEQGMAIDRAGRVIDVPSAVCIRIKKFIDSQSDSDQSLSFKDGKGSIADVFVRFTECQRGKTPAFADNNYDATDAFAANRLLDGFRMELVLRKDDPKVPVDPWANVLAQGAAGGTATSDAVKKILLNAKDIVGGNPVEYPDGYDTTAVYLARITIKGSRTGPGQKPSLDYKQITVDNMSRLFIYPTALLARGLELLTVKP